MNSCCFNFFDITTGLRTEYIIDHIPFVVLKKIQTEPPCSDHQRAVHNFGSMLDDFRRRGRPMIVDYDHELSVLNSECQYTFVDFDNACYNHASNTGINVENPFKLITGMPTTNFISCSEKIHAPSMKGLTAHAHVLLRWNDMYHRIQRQPGELARAISDNPDPDGIDKPKL